MSLAPAPVSGPWTRDERRLSAIGRHARLDLRFERRGQRTVLVHAYAEPPLRIGRTYDVDDAACLILACAAPGVFAGDRLEQRVSVGSGARVLLVSQSALQVHPGTTAAAAPAEVHSEYIVEPDAELHTVFDPVIPFARSSLVQRFDLRVASSGRLCWSDAAMSGRASRGERWRFGLFDHELRLAIDGRLTYLERYALRPEERLPFHAWRAGPADYAGTCLMHHAEASAAVAERLHREVAGIDALRAAVDLVEPRLMVARLLSASGPAFARGRTALRAAALGAVFGAPQLVVRR